MVAPLSDAVPPALTRAMEEFTLYVAELESVRVAELLERLRASRSGLPPPPPPVVHGPRRHVHEGEELRTQIGLVIVALEVVASLLNRLGTDRVRALFTEPSDDEVPGASVLTPSTIAASVLRARSLDSSDDERAEAREMASGSVVPASLNVDHMGRPPTPEEGGSDDAATSRGSWRRIEAQMEPPHQDSVDLTSTSAEQLWTSALRDSTRRTDGSRTTPSSARSGRSPPPVRAAEAMKFSASGSSHKTRDRDAQQATRESAKRLVKTLSSQMSTWDRVNRDLHAGPRA